MPQKLKNKSIVITRDQYQSQSLIQKIEALGGKAVEFPTIKIVGTSDWEKCDVALDEIRNLDWIIFTSSNSVRFFMGRAKYMGIDHLECSIAAVGAKTAEELERYDLKADLVPENYSAEGLLNAFNLMDIENKHMLIPSSNLAKEQLPQGLRAMGAHVNNLVVYKTVPNISLEGKEMNSMIEKSSIDCLTFFSPSAFNFFLDIVGNDVINTLEKNKVAIAVIGPTTSKAVKNKGLKPDIEPEKSDENSLLEAINKYFN